MAALIADALATRVKFFSIGSNDLIQYTLAADRTNEKVSHLYEPTHPAIVRLIKMTVDASHRHNIWTGVCGEIGGDPMLVPLLIGLGIDELSCAPAVIPEVKYMIRRVKVDEARLLAEFAKLRGDVPFVAGRAPADVPKDEKELRRLVPDAWFLAEQALRGASS